MHCAKCGRELPEGTTNCSCEPSVPPQAETGRGLAGFVRAYAPILVIAVLILIIILVQPMIPHGFSIVGSFTKGPFQQQIATQNGPRDVEVWLETSLVPPPGFKYRNSQLERLHPRLIPVRWSLEVDGLAAGQEPACLTAPPAASRCAARTAAISRFRRRAALAFPRAS